jgi:hypothetical protein
MPKIFWYYCLIAIGIALIIFTMYKKRKFADLFSILLAFASFAYLCEVLVLFGLDSYAYKPGLFQDPMAENIWGHLVCNGFFWGGTALFVTAFSLKFRWIIAIAISYMLIEILFLKVEAYEHHWWPLYLTGAAAIVIFSMMKKWYSKLQEKNNKLLRHFTFFMISWVILQGTSVLLSLFQKQHFTVGFVENIYRDDILFSVPYQLFLSLLYVIFVSVLKKWYYKIAALIISLITDGIFVLINVLILINGWNFFYLTLLRCVGFVFFIVLEKYTLKLNSDLT